MWLLLIFVAIPIIEIGLFIQVGGWLGLWPTLGIFVLTAFVGTTLLRLQGTAALARVQSSMTSGENPAGPIAHGALILVAAILLLTPGFFTDGVGLALLLPPVRAALISWGATKMLASQNVVFTHSHPQHPKPANDTVEGDYVILDDEDTKPGNSGWTKGGD